MKDKKVRKTGKPRALEAEEELNERQSPEEFAREMFGDAGQPQQELPSIEWLKSQFKTKSACIRYLVHIGVPVNVIAKHLDIRYQMVRNVKTTELKRGPNEDWRPKGERTGWSTDGHPPTKEGD